jgi:uncharacterized Zn finger protein
MPCADKQECSDITKKQTFQTTSHQEHEDENEACNPFCTCYCCGQVYATSFNFTKITAAKPFATQTKHSFYKSIALPTNFLGNIWQPPKLA